MQAITPAPARHCASSELINNDDLLILNDVVDITDLELLGLQAHAAGHSNHLLARDVNAARTGSGGTCMYGAAQLWLRLDGTRSLLGIDNVLMLGKGLASCAVVSAAHLQGIDDV